MNDEAQQLSDDNLSRSSHSSQKTREEEGSRRGEWFNKLDWADEERYTGYGLDRTRYHLVAR